MFRRRLLLGLLSAGFIVSWTLVCLGGTTFPDRRAPDVRFPQSSDTLPKVATDLLSIFRQYEPVPKKINVTHPAKTSAEPQDGLAELVQIDYEDVKNMRRIHQQLVESLPEYPPLFFGKGIVMVGGGQFLRIALHSLRMLRRSGTTLPVELWMSDENEFSEEFCAEVSTLNVRCRIVAEYLGEEVVERYQLKSFAIFLSSFEEVLFLDADNFPVTSVDEIFTSTGVTIWPDYWASTTSPLLFDIVDSPQTFFRTCETGQLLWNKRTHFRTLELALYYNFYGPDYFYPLLTQFAAGQGDKETFQIACQVTNQTYTFIDTPVQTLGYHADEFHGTGMIQADPRNYTQGLFIHAHHPKFEAVSLLSKGAPVIHRSSSFWGSIAMEVAGYDIEEAAFQELAYVECNSSLARPFICGQLYEVLIPGL
jgi:alpha 1,2-mannosyltransferase